jgi:hypothetical protein
MLSVEFSLFNIKQQARRNSPLIAGAALPSKMSQTSFSIREGAINNSYSFEERKDCFIFYYGEGKSSSRPNFKGPS